MNIGINCRILKKQGSWTKLRAALIYGNKHKHLKSNLTTGPFRKILAVVSSQGKCPPQLLAFDQSFTTSCVNSLLEMSPKLVGYSPNIQVTVAPNITSYLNTLMTPPPHPTAACLASPGTMKTSQQGTSLQLRSSLIFLRLTTKMCCVFSSGCCHLVLVNNQEPWQIVLGPWSLPDQQFIMRYTWLMLKVSFNISWLLRITLDG